MKNQIDKSKELEAGIVLLNNRLHFNGKVEGNTPVSIDYLPPLGDNLGYTSLELLLLSFSSCLGSALLVFLRKMQKTIAAFEISTRGIRHEDHPTGFKSIQMEVHLSSPDTNVEELEKLTAMAEEKYCPVWAMIRGNVEVTVRYKISKGA